MNKELKELQDFLNSANGEITITINGMIPHVQGNMNESGAILAVFALMKIIEHTQNHDMQEVMEMLLNLNHIMGYHFEGRIYGEDL